MHDGDPLLVPKHNIRPILVQDVLNFLINRSPLFRAAAYFTLFQERVQFGIMIPAAILSTWWRILTEKSLTKDSRSLKLGPLVTPKLKSSGQGILLQIPPFHWLDDDIDTYFLQLCSHGFGDLNLCDVGCGFVAELQSHTFLLFETGLLQDLLGLKRIT